MDTKSVHGEGFNSKTGGFKYIIVGEKRYRAEFIAKLIQCYELLTAVEKDT